MELKKDERLQIVVACIIYLLFLSEADAELLKNHKKESVSAVFLVQAEVAMLEVLQQCYFQKISDLDLQTGGYGVDSEILDFFNQARL